MLNELTFMEVSMKRRTTSDIVSNIVMNVIFLVFVNTVPLWLDHTRGVVLPAWSNALWAMNVSTGAQLAGYLFLLFYRPQWLDGLLRAVFAAAGLLAVIVFFIVFPIDFSAISLSWLNTALRVVLWVGMAGSLIGVIVGLVKFGRAAVVASAR